MLPEEAFAFLSRSSGQRQRFEHRFALAGLDVLLHSSVEPLADLFFRPFSHLQSAESARADTQLDVEIVTGTPRPQLENAPRGDGFFRSAGSHRFHASPDGRFVCHEVLASNSVWCLDRHNRRIIGWVESAERVTHYEMGKPFANLLSLVVEPFGRYLIHAAVVSWRGQGVLFAGPGGAGKSTSALACLRGGFDFIGEDLVILDENPEDHFTAHSAYNSAWIEPGHLMRFGGLATHAQNSREVEQNKSLLMLADIFPGQLSASTPLRFIMIPRINPGTASAIEPAVKPDAFKQLAPNCLMTATRIDMNGFQTLARLVQATPCFQLTLGDDLDRVPDLIKRRVEA